MDFEFSEEQVALQDSVERLLADQHGHEARRRIAASEAGWSAALWRQWAELGLTALPVPECHGGLGGRGDDLMVVMQAVGRSLLATPWLGSGVVPARALAAGAMPAVADDWLPRLAAGTAMLAWAHDEPDGDGSAAWVATRAQREGDTWQLTGYKSAVHHGASADAFLVTARLHGADGDAAGRALFLVHADAAGLMRRDLRLIDGTPASTLTLQDVAAQPVATEPAAAARAIGAALAWGMAGTCAEMFGAMDAALHLTVEYLQTRQQFGRAIGQNQALRHALADMKVSLELARSMAIAAAVQCEACGDSAFDAESGAAAQADLHRAKLVLGRHARGLAEAAVQLHGGIGMSEEYAVGNFLRRVLVLETRFGDAACHVAALAEAAA